MNPPNEQAIRHVVEEVLAQLGRTPRSRQNGQTASNGSRTWGVFTEVDHAVAAAQDGFEQLQQLPLEQRAKMIHIVREICFDQAEELGRKELEETKIGRLDHKIEKLKAMRQVPGIEWLKSDCVSGDHGLTVTEYAPFGVIGAITPVTHSLPTLAGNVINMVSAGNTMVVNPHPSGQKIAVEGVKLFNQAIYQAVGIENVITIIEEPTIESAEAIFNHRGVRLLCVTGGPGVARAALASRKRAIVAGPGNPPVVVDETANLNNAARSIVQGAAYDNNLLCIGEKEVFVVDSVFDSLLKAVANNGGYLLNAQQVQALTAVAFQETITERGKKFVLNRDLIGADPTKLAETIGLRVPDSTQILFGETDTSNPFVPEEQMMPFIPFVRARDFDQALLMAKEFEHGFGHTSIIHTQDVSRMTKMGRLMDTTLFIKNGPCMAGLGLGGEGYLSFSVATPTGEGVTNPLTFTRQRRCALVDDLRII